jgi:hypothetical protein
MDEKLSAFLTMVLNGGLELHGQLRTPTILPSKWAPDTLCIGGWWVPEMVNQTLVIQPLDSYYSNGFK